nr:hypothetical protein [Paenibacillus bovis]
MVKLVVFGEVEEVESVDGVSEWLLDEKVEKGMEVDCISICEL